MFRGYVAFYVKELSLFIFLKKNDAMINKYSLFLKKKK